MGFVHLGLLLGVLGTGAEPGAGLPKDPAALVEQLGSPRFAEREEATRLLEGLGEEALEALRAARDSRDPEVRTRATELLDRIETARLVKPTMVRLDFRDRPLAEVVKALSDRTGISMALVPENNPLWQRRRVTLEAPEPVPFWKMMDLLARDAQVQHTITSPGMSPRAAAVQLTLSGTSTASGGQIPPVDQGPFRLLLTGIHYSRDRSFLPNGPTGAIILNQQRRNLRARGENNILEQFYLDMQIHVEPRLAPTVSGPVQVTEAVDDLGQNLVPPEQGNETTYRSSGYFGITGNGGPLVLQVPLKHPDKPGKVIRRLAGKVPLLVTSRKDNPVSILLAESKGKTFQAEDVTFTIHEVKADAQNPGTNIELTIRPIQNAAATAAPFNNAALMAYRGPQFSQTQLELLDAQGRTLPYHTWSMRADAEEMRITLRLLPVENLGAPTHLRYYALARATTEVEFDFRDVPMP